MIHYLCENVIQDSGYNSKKQIFQRKRRIQVSIKKMNGFFGQIKMFSQIVKESNKNKK